MRLLTGRSKGMVALLLVGCGCVAGCGAGKSTVASQTATGGGTGGGTGTGSGGGTTGTKTPIMGLVSMGPISFITNASVTPDNTMEEPNTNANVYSAAVVNVTWKQLQSTQGGTVDTSAIEAGLNAIAAYNTAHAGHTMTAKLRVFAGINAPGWAMTLDGPAPVDMSGASNYSFPRFWTASYQAAWTALQNQLAAIYDKDTRIQEVAVSGCSSKSDEPFIQPLDTATLAEEHGYGLTDAQLEACLMSMPTQYAAWTVTPLDYTFNTYNATDAGYGVANPTFTVQVMAAWRAALGTTRGVIANHGLQNPLATAAQPVYAEMQVLGGPIEFQTYSPTVSWDSTIQLGLTYKPTEIEIWPTTQAGGYAPLTLTQLQTYASELP